MPPSEPPMTAATCFTPRSSRSSLCNLVCCQQWDKARLPRSWGRLPNVISDGREREFWAISTLGRVAVLGSDGTGGPVWAAQAVQAYYEEAGRVEGAARTAEQRAPPVGHVGAAGEGMADDHDIVAVGRERASGGVCHGHIEEDHARFKRERGDDGNLLVRYEGRERVLGLRGDSFLEVFSHRSSEGVGACGGPRNRCKIWTQAYSPYLGRSRPLRRASAVMMATFLCVCLRVCVRVRACVKTCEEEEDDNDDATLFPRQHYLT